ncbi:L-xylulose reductase [Culicoides brevitarsis]|uniref:L-xylulose reductase n=1 Tax=Culicoides brevitarsis TaxID=469753 RepID=UPI00307BED37
MELEVKGKSILVTGAGHGIGNQLCKTLHELGAKVIAVSRNQKPLDELAAECSGIKTIAVDLAKWQETREALKNITFLDALVNSAGVAVIKPFAEMTESDFDHQFNVNFKAIYNLCQFLSPKIRDGGSIVNISSLASMIGIEGHSVYGPTKAALDNFMKNLVLELGPRKIRVNNVNPTVILTRMGRENWSDPAKADPLISRIPLRRFGEVHEVVEPIIFLLSDKSSFINGHCLPLEGGYLTA